MFGNGLENMNMLRLNHVKQIIESLTPHSAKVDDDITILINRESEFVYEVDLHHNDHFGHTYQFTFEHNKLINKKRISSWMS